MVFMHMNWWDTLMLNSNMSFITSALRGRQIKVLVPWNNSEHLTVTLILTASFDCNGHLLNIFFVKLMQLSFSCFSHSRSDCEVSAHIIKQLDSRKRRSMLSVLKQLNSPRKIFITSAVQLLSAPVIFIRKVISGKEQGRYPVKISRINLFTVIILF